MDSLPRPHALDYLLAMLWAGTLAWGLKSGGIRQLGMLVAIYGGAVVAAQAYQPTGAALTLVTGRDHLVLARFAAYLILYALVVILVYWGSRALYPDTRLAGKRGLDSALGAVVAGIWGGLLLVGLVGLVQVFVAAPIPGQEAFQRSLEQSVQRSTLVTAATTLPPLWPAMQPWLPQPLTRS